MAEREMTSAPARLAMLHTRAAPSARIHDDWVAWLIGEHMPQLTAGSRLLGSWCYRSSAAGSTAGPHYMVSYLAPDLATLREWLASPLAPGGLVQAAHSTCSRAPVVEVLRLNSPLAAAPILEP